MRNFKKIKMKVVNTMIMLSLLTPFYIKRKNIIFTNDNAYESLSNDDNKPNTVIFDPYIDDLSKLDEREINTLVIRNSSYLTNEEKEIISNSSINNLVITYGLTDINDQNLNLDFINDDVNVSIIFDEVIKNFDKDNELYNFLIYKKYKDYKENNKNNIFLLENFTEKEIEKFDIFDRHLNDIVSMYNIDKNDPDYNKIISIISYVTDHIYYDKDVSDNNEQGKKDSTNYNNNILSSILENEPYIKCEGICCNYAALTTVLGYYANVDLDYMTGIEKESGHSWNEYIDNGNKVVFDTTSLDGWETYQELIFEYSLYKQKNDINENITNGLIKVLESDKDYYDNRFEVFKEYSKKYDVSKIEWFRRMILFFGISTTYLLLYTSKEIEDNIKVKKLR